MGLQSITVKMHSFVFVEFVFVGEMLRDLGNIYGIKHYGVYMCCYRKIIN